SATKALGFDASCRDCGLSLRRVVTHVNTMQRALAVVYNRAPAVLGNRENRVWTFRTGVLNLLRVGTMAGDYSYVKRSCGRASEMCEPRSSKRWPACRCAKDRQSCFTVSGHSKPSSKGRMKTSHLEKGSWKRVRFLVF